MISDERIVLALRARLLSLTVAVTGTMTLASSAAGGNRGASAYTRSTGSFIDDGFRVGMEIKPAGFPANLVTTLEWVTATVATVKDPLTSSAAAGGRSLTVGLPAGRRWENVPFDPLTGRPYIEEQYLPGPSFKASIGNDGWLRAEPMYVVHTYVPDGVGGHADAGYTDALRVLFKPGTAMALTNGDILRVRGDTAPYKGQRLNAIPGWVVAPFNIPLQVYSQNI